MVFQNNIFVLYQSLDVGCLIATGLSNGSTAPIKGKTKTWNGAQKKMHYRFSYWRKHQNCNEMKCNGVRRGKLLACKSALIVALCF